MCVCVCWWQLKVIHVEKSKSSSPYCQWTESQLTVTSGSWQTWAHFLIWFKFPRFICSSQVNTIISLKSKRIWIFHWIINLTPIQNQLAHIVLFIIASTLPSRHLWPLRACISAITDKEKTPSNASRYFCLILIMSNKSTAFAKDTFQIELSDNSLCRCDPPPASICLGRGSEHRLKGHFSRWMRVVCQRLDRSVHWRHFTGAAVPCSSSIVLCETNLGLIHACFPSLLSRAIRPVFSSPPSPSLHPNPLSLVCMCAYEPITGMEKPQIVYSKWGRDLMNFLCCFMALRGLHGVMGFIWDLRATAENWKTSAFHGTMVLIVMALSPWCGLEWETHQSF